MKDTVIFDTHRVIKRFVAVGFTEEQAEVVCQEQKEIIENNLATKQDIAEINFKIESMSKTTKQDIAEVNFKIESLRQETKKSIAEINFKIEILKKDIEQINFKTEGLKKDIENLRQETKKDIENLRQETKKDIELATKKMYLAIFSSIGFFVTLLKILQLLK